MTYTNIFMYKYTHIQLLCVKSTDHKRSNNVLALAASKHEKQCKKKMNRKGEKLMVELDCSVSDCLRVEEKSGTQRVA